MPQDSSVHYHFHIYDGASPEAVRAAVEAARSGPVASAPAVEQPQDGEAEVTHEQFLAYVEAAYNDSYEKAVPLLEYLADNPDRMVPFSELSKTLGFDSNRSLPGLLGAFGRRAAHRYEGVKPFEAHYRDGEWHLRMSQDAADVINRLR